MYVCMQATEIVPGRLYGPETWPQTFETPKSDMMSINDFLLILH